MTKEKLENLDKKYQGIFLTIILDPAHGSDVAGKCSPDGVHKEYIWSRKICSQLYTHLIQLGYTVSYTTKAEKEIGLTKRKTIANNVPLEESKVKLLMSLHNNAAGSDNQWYNATGVEIFTSKGKTQSDIFSSIMYAQLHKDFPELAMRYGNRDLWDCDKDENFTVLMGNYQAMLIEWLFQDGRNDISKLTDDKYNERFVESLLKGIEEINDYIHNTLIKSV